MKTRYCTSLCLFTALAVVLAGCLEEEIQSYDGPPQIGFQFQDSEATVWDGSGAHAVEVQLIAPHQPADVQASVGIDSETTTATNYSFDDVVTIDANSSTTNLIINIGDNEIAPGESATLVVVLEEALTDGVEIASNLRTHTVTIDGERAILEFEPEDLDFGEVRPGDERTLTLTLENAGNKDTEVREFAIGGEDADAFSYELPEGANGSISIAAGEAAELEVTFSPIEEADYSAELLMEWTEGTTAPEGAEASVELTGSTPPTVAAAIQAHDDLSTLASLLEQEELLEDLEGAGPFTVFAPDDIAFDAIDLDAIDEGDLGDILLGHVVGAEYTAAELAGMDGATLTTLAGTELTVTVETDEAGEVTSIVIDNSVVLEADVLASNGYVHVIDAVIGVEPAEEEDDENDDNGNNGDDNGDGNGNGDNG